MKMNPILVYYAAGLESRSFDSLVNELRLNGIHVSNLQPDQLEKIKKFIELEKHSILKSDLEKITGIDKLIIKKLNQIRDAHEIGLRIVFSAGPKKLATPQGAFVIKRNY